MKISIFLHGFLFLANVNALNNCTDDIIDITIWPPPYTYYLNQTDNWTIYEINNNTGALCTDGTNYKFYFREGMGSGLKKFMIFFPGGGYCGYDNTDFLASCWKRSTSYAGSSQFSGENGSVYQTNYSFGYFDNDEKINPFFWNWNKVYMTYCDGTLFQGYREEPIEFNGSQLYFRGYNNTIALLDFLKKNMKLFEAEEVIVIGVSSGAQAVLIWINYIKAYLPSSVKVKGISDAGFFMDNVNQNSLCHLFRSHMMVIANFTNSSNLDLFQGCKHRNNSKKFYKCLIPQYFMKDINADMFIINSQNDFEVLRTVYGLHCLDYGINNCNEDVNNKIVKFRQKFLKTAFALKKKKPTWGFWLRRCIEHYYMNSIAWIGNLTAYSAESDENKNIRETLYEWYGNGHSPSFIDLKNWQDDCPVKGK